MDVTFPNVSINSVVTETEDHPRRAGLREEKRTPRLQSNN